MYSTKVMAHLFYFVPAPLRFAIGADDFERGFIFAGVGGEMLSKPCCVSDIAPTHGAFLFGYGFTDDCFGVH